MSESTNSFGFHSSDSGGGGGSINIGNSNLAVTPTEDRTLTISDGNYFRILDDYDTLLGSFESYIEISSFEDLPNEIHENYQGFIHDLGEVEGYIKSYGGVYGGGVNPQDINVQNEMYIESVEYGGNVYTSVGNNISGGDVNGGIQCGGTPYYEPLSSYSTSLSVNHDLTLLQSSEINIGTSVDLQLTSNGSFYLSGSDGVETNIMFIFDSVADTWGIGQDNANLDHSIYSNIINYTSESLNTVISDSNNLSGVGISPSFVSMSSLDATTFNGVAVLTDKGKSRISTIAGGLPDTDLAVFYEDGSYEFSSGQINYNAFDGSLIINALILSLPSTPIGNVGLLAGDIYMDTAANALANGDLILIQKQ